MRKPFILLLVLLFLTPVFAADPTLIMMNQPKLEIYTDSYSYEAGDVGMVTAKISTYGMLEDVLLEIEVLSPVGKLVGGDIIYTKIPVKTIINPTATQTEQMIYHEDIEYLESEKTVSRTVPFEIPLDAIGGFYTLNVRMSTPEMRMETSEKVFIEGGGEKVDLIILMYLLGLVLTVYLLWRD